MLRPTARVQPWLAAAAVLLVSAVVLPPAESYARQYAFVQAVQFVIFAVVAPALLAGSVSQAFGLMARRVEAGEHAVHTAIGRLAAFIALVIIWRLPVMLNALAQYPALVAGEMVTLVAAGCGIWLVLAGQPARQPLPCPLRAATAALAMWAIWAIAYFTGMSTASLTSAHGPAVARILSVAADRQVAVGIMWAVPAVCFLPVIFTMLIVWTSDRTGQETRSVAAEGCPPSGFGVAPPPPRGWRSPAAGSRGHRRRPGEV